MMLQLGNPIDVGNCVFKQFWPIGFSNVLCVKNMVLPVRPEIILWGFSISKWPEGASH